MLIKEKLKVLEEESNKLKEELKCSNVYAGTLMSRLFSYDIFITNEKLFRVTISLEVERFKISFRYLDRGENCENIKYKEPAKDKEGGRSDILSSPSFLSPVSNLGPRLKHARAGQLFIFLSWLRLDSSLKRTAWIFNLFKSTVSGYIIT